MGTAILVASGKGGTGKTSFCANVAVALCALGEKVLLVDADAGLRSLDLVLGMSDSVLFSYADVIRGDASLKEAAVRHPIVRSLRLLTAPASDDGQERPDSHRLCTLIRRACEHFSFVLIDGAAGLGREIADFAPAADRGVIVSTGDSIALRAAQKAARTLQSGGVPSVYIVVNRVRRGMIDAGAAVSIDRAMDASGLALLGAVPEDDDVAICAGCGQVLALESDGDAGRAFFNIARRLRGERVGLLHGMKGRYE